MDLVDEYKEYKLDNGFSVVLEKTSSYTVGANLRVWHGGLNERPHEHGLAHILEHTLLFGGSEKYSPKDADKIMGMIGSFQAFTYLNKTEFPVDMLPKHLSLFIEYISDSVINPRLDSERVEEEKKIILKENARDRSKPSFVDSLTYKKAFFGENSPRSYSLLGNDSIIKSCSPKNLKLFHSRGYIPNNMELILSGALPKNIEDIIERNFGLFSIGNSEKIIIPKNKPINSTIILHSYAPELLNIENPLESNTDLSMSFIAPTETEKDTYDVKMLTSILGGGINSRLFKNIRQRKGLVYNINSSYNGCDNMGAISIYAETQSLRQNEVIDSIFYEMEKLSIDLISNNKLNILKDKARYSILKSLESNKDRIKIIEMKKDYGLTPESYLEGMNSVTPESVREAAIKYFPINRKDGKYVLSLRDPLKK